MSNSECSSGCESGWTLYLDQSSQGYNNHENLNYQDYNRGKQEYVDDDDDDDADLSMVSDASSGPPNMNEHENYYHESSSASALVKKSEKKQKNKERSEKKNRQSYLDDTASSPVFSFSKGKPSLKKHFGFFKNSRSSKPASAEPGGLKGRKWE
ncbi:hypothetical protein RJ641_032076 [Dillenia turbinata]|uniref:Uncharacterized protein n=1 Tax=Dillenia turbinata TaxID=194707 RepID=A0AAN8ZLI1_9MAGN